MVNVFGIREPSEASILSSGRIDTGCWQQNQTLPDNSLESVKVVERNEHGGRQLSRSA
jgi:hypothetical protein